MNELRRAALPYFGSCGLWAEALRVGGFAFRSAEHYQRRTQRNRCAIADGQGRRVLSVPLAAGKHERCGVREVRIHYAGDWPRRHFHTLRSAYGRAPFWPEYAGELADLYARRPALLWDWNWGCVAWLRDQLAPGLILAEADNWQGGDDARGYPLTPQPHLPPYPQVFSERHGWLSNLSALDALLCQGPSAAGYLRAVPT